MASWIIHLRIAEKLAEKYDVDTEKFIGGSIAPDCGKKLGDGIFSPPTKITHFTSEGKGKCDYNGFAQKYMKTVTDYGKFSFYLGYFAHLMTDVLWSRLINAPAKERFAHIYNADRLEYYRRVKGDWYGLDFLYLSDNPDFPMWRKFREMKDFPNDYLEFYDNDNMSLQFASIVSFYSKGRKAMKREHKYLTKPQADKFVETAADEICREIDSRKEEWGIIPRMKGESNE